MISVCPRHDELRISKIYGLGGGRQFVPENFESYNKSLDEIYQESLEDDMYLLDISGVTLFLSKMLASFSFQRTSPIAKLRKLMDNTPGTILDLKT